MTPESWAEWCLTVLGWRPPDPPSPNRLAQVLGITVIGKPTGPRTWDGTSGRDRDLWWICLNRSRPWTRRQWTLAHEIGHILQHGDRRVRGLWHRDGSAANVLEREADRFAAAFLMPEALMDALVMNAVQPLSVEALARYLGLSEQAVARRLEELYPPPFFDVPRLRSRHGAAARQGRTCSCGRLVPHGCISCSEPPCQA